MITVSYDKEVDTTYIKVTPEEVVDLTLKRQGYSVELNADAKVIGVEFLGSPRELKNRLNRDPDPDDAWTDIYEFVRHF